MGTNIAHQQHNQIVQSMKQGGQKSANIIFHDQQQDKPQEDQ